MVIAAALIMTQSSVADATYAAAVSPNWAGLVGTRPPGGNYAQVFGVWTVPAVKCPTQHTVASEWVGLDGSGSSTVEQAGTQTECDNGKPNYFAWYEFYNGPCCQVPIPRTTLDIVPGENVPLVVLADVREESVIDFDGAIRRHRALAD